MNGALRVKHGFAREKAITRAIFRTHTHTVLSVKPRLYGALEEDLRRPCRECVCVGLRAKITMLECLKNRPNPI